MWSFKELLWWFFKCRYSHSAEVQVRLQFLTCVFSTLGSPDHFSKFFNECFNQFLDLYWSSKNSPVKCTHAFSSTVIKLLSIMNIFSVCMAIWVWPWHILSSVSENASFSVDKQLIFRNKMFGIGEHITLEWLHLFYYLWL